MKNWKQFTAMFIGIMMSAMFFVDAQKTDVMIKGLI